MSRIKKALEKAKAEKALEEGSEGRATERAGRAAAPSDEAARAHAPVRTRTRVVPTSPEVLRTNRIVGAAPGDPEAEPFGLLRTRILQRTRHKGWNTLQITGFGVGEGKSLVSANLAVSMAKDTRHTTLLVDLDFRRPSIHRLFGLEEGAKGLDAYFLEGVPLDEILVSPGIEKLALLPTTGVISDATELMGSPRMEALVRELRERYEDRYILFDTPAINVCPDPLVIAEYMDAMLLVARAGRTKAASIEAALDQIPREKVIGLVLNDASGPEAGAYDPSAYAYQRQ